MHHIVRPHPFLLLPLPHTKLCLLLSSGPAFCRLVGIFGSLQTELFFPKGEKKKEALCSSGMEVALRYEKVYS